ncbi:T9SS type A sorting domain-containing protein [Ferruginibacter yonginensis]|uniref:T9SS type A sorting domain-containing protein n=1 Tax=Ferruginibacter yonginensis TaxID=1310416 RepID=A0ABV8QR10_9BACT
MNLILQKPTSIFNAIAIMIAALFFSNTINAQCTDYTASTSFVSNNSNKGVMFSITANSSPVTITGFDFNCIGFSAGEFEIYYKTGDYVGFTTNAAAWTLAPGCPFSVTALGTNNVTPLPIELSVTIPANGMVSFYVTNNDGGIPAGIRYTNIAAPSVAVADANITLSSGIGKSYPFGADYNYRLVNCIVHYYTGNLNQAQTLSTVNTNKVFVNQSNNATNTYAAKCDQLVCRVTGTGANPVNGTTAARVWLETTQPAQYVKRHYEITPENNASTATGNVILYFTQQEFNDFNAVNALKLPVNAADAAGIANLRIEKRPGTSSDETGLPNSYTGTPITINPSDAAIIWNATFSRWEVTVPVTGFSGFFVKTTNSILPIQLISFNAIKKEGYQLIQWKAAATINTTRFEIERSSDGYQFESIANIATNGQENFQYNDYYKINGQVYYRLKMIADQSTEYRYSNIIKLGNGNIGASVYPNPTKTKSTISVNQPLVGTKATILNTTGTVVSTLILQHNNTVIETSNLTTGMYLIRFEDGTVLKMIKQ